MYAVIMALLIIKDVRKNGYCLAKHRIEKTNPMRSRGPVQTRINGWTPLSFKGVIGESSMGPVLFLRGIGD